MKEPEPLPFGLEAHSSCGRTWAQISPRFHVVSWDGLRWWLETEDKGPATEAEMRELADGLNKVIAKTLTPQDELAKIDADIKRLEERRREIYKASLTAPENEKVAEDFFAGILSQEPLPHLQYPIEVTGITFEGDTLKDRETSGQLVKVRRAKDKDTHLGIYLGRFPLSTSAMHNPKTGVLGFNLSMHNPCIWIPALKTITFGCESWWGPIKSEKDFEEITDKTIDEQWYVKALKGKLGEQNGS